MQMESLRDKVVIVTGSSSGIGEATAVLFARYGSKVVITGRSKKRVSNVSRLCKQVSPTNCDNLALVGDITSDSFRETLLNETIAFYGKLDILVNNAGGTILANILSDEFPDVFDTVMSTNMKAPLMLSRISLPYLIESKGCIINMSSVASFRFALENNMHYNISKAALDSITRTLAHDFGPRGVRVVSVNPGVVKTRFLQRINLPDSIFDDWGKLTPLQRVAEAQEVATVVCTLASSNASYITGASVVVDGGLITV